MSPTSEARAALARLLAETEEDLVSAMRQMETLSSLLAAPGAWSAQSPSLSVAALALHHYYTAIESFLERVARTFEGRLPSDADWHRTLLHGATLELENVRPALLSAGAERCLLELLRFRHFLRHAYSAELDAERLKELTSEAVSCADKVSADLAAFREHLRRSLESLAT